MLPQIWWLSGSHAEPGFGTALDLVVPASQPLPGPGDRLGVVGPLGRGFRAPSSALPAIVVGHEAQGATARWWAQRLRGRGCSVHLVLSASDPDRHADAGAARRCADSVVLTTPDDLATALASLIARHDPAVVYAATPPELSAVVGQVAGTARIASQVTLLRESAALCGLGLCGGCEVTLSTPRGQRVRPCVDGPVLPGDRVDWTHPQVVERVEWTPTQQVGERVDVDRGAG